jgi:phenylacetate-CoA ligase
VTETAERQVDRQTHEAGTVARLADLVSEVGAHNRFYQRLWREAGVGDPPPIRSSADLRKLPFTTKQQLVDDQLAHPPFGTIPTYPLERYVRFHQTSGTTGVPLRWLDTPESWAWWLRCWRLGYRLAGVGPGDRILFAFSFGPFIGFWAGYEAAQAIGALVLPGGGQESKLRLRTLRETQATVLVCTPTYALRLAQVAREEGTDPAGTSVRATIHAGEPGASIPGTRHRIQELWGAACFDHYGLTEVGALAFECQAHPGGLHVNEDEFVVEILDVSSGAPVAEGEGELVVTNLGRVGSPVIRYRTGDRVRLLREPCACGQPFARLDGGVLGRADDMLVVRGMNIFPRVIEDVVRRRALVEEFRIEVYQQHEMDEVRVALEMSRDCRPPEAAREAEGVAAALRARLGIRIETTVVPSGTLPRPELKARRVVRIEGPHGGADWVYPEES